MKRLIKRFPFTMIAATAGIMTLLLGVTLHLDLWEKVVAVIAAGEGFELDELIIPLFILMVGITADSVLSRAELKREKDMLELYNQMNEETMDEISTHLTKLLEFRTALMKDAPKALDIRHELDRMIVKSFNHYERAQRRGNIDSSLMDLAFPNLPSKPTSMQSNESAPSPEKE
jgi:multisubunit Na+/H+ antiporter MnhG subunit